MSGVQVFGCVLVALIYFGAVAVIAIFSEDEDLAVMAGIFGMMPAFLALAAISGGLS